MKISSEDRLVQVVKKEEQRKREKILRENRVKEAKAKSDIRRPIIIGNLFCKHFPIAMEISPGRSTMEDDINFECLDNCMEALANFLQSYQELEDYLLEKK